MVTELGRNVRGRWSPRGSMDGEEKPKRQICWDVVYLIRIHSKFPSLQSRFMLWKQDSATWPYGPSPNRHTDVSFLRQWGEGVMGAGSPPDSTLEFSGVRERGGAILVLPLTI